LELVWVEVRSSSKIRIAPINSAEEFLLRGNRQRQNYTIDYRNHFDVTFKNYQPQ